MTDRHSSKIEWAKNQTTIIQTIYEAVCGIIHLRTLIVLSRRPLVLLSRQLGVESPVVALPSRPLVTPPSRLLASPLIVLSLHRPLFLSLRRLVFVALPLVALPSCPLAHSHPLVVLSPGRPLTVSLRRLVDVSPLVPQSSRPLIILSLHPLSSSNGAGWLLRSLLFSLLLRHRRPALSYSRHPLTVPPSCPWSTHKRLLSTFNDRQHNLRWLAEEIEFHRGSTFTASTKIVQKGRSKRNTTKSSSRLRSPPHPFLKIHRTLSSNE